MARISFSYLCPASWYFTVPTVSPFLRQRVAFLGLFFISCLLLLMLIIDFRHWSASLPRDRQYERYLARVGELEATDTEDPNLNYGLVVDCGSSGSRIFVYFWPRHNGNPHDLLDIKQMRDRNSQPVVKKIKPGISAMADTPEHASDYLRPLLSFAAAHVPVKKHKETPLYILCTAGMRLLPERKQLAILADLVKDLPLEFDFLFSQSQAEVISGKQEGVYAWIGINFVLGRFDHDDESDAEATQELAAGRRRTVGILDMGGASLQIAYEVPTSTSVLPAKQEEAAKILLAEFNLGCDVQHTEHVYRVYVTTFLGFGGNFARQRYEDLVLNETLNKNRLLGQKTGLSPDNPFLDPCLPVGLTDVVERNSQVLHVRGRGDWVSCGAMLSPLLARSNTSQASLNGIYQSPIDFNNSEFYGFSEFFYCTEDVLRIGGRYHGPTFAKAAQDYCGMAWSVLTQRFKNGLFSSHADEHRLKDGVSQCCQAGLELLSSSDPPASPSQSARITDISVLNRLGCTKSYMKDSTFPMTTQTCGQPSWCMTERFSGRWEPFYIKHDSYHSDVELFSGCLLYQYFNPIWLLCGNDCQDNTSRPYWDLATSSKYLMDDST
ncbi:ectonucleoside triphosphate diphosphohydrolase 7 isoform X2 [Gorilla gorilla gorilla]|uniref:ectonucleoside triphosphate diphosphohydrolase 7 isoform X2 n=1 Tax=Gorilla gorilla gorilla TaxID=9595 RepID=UPI0030099847